MTVILIITVVLAVVGLLLWLLDKRGGGEVVTGDPQPADSDPEEGCCGMHITCEKDSLLASVSDKIEYFDDEELDRFRGRAADNYTEPEIEEFRDVLLTLLPDDIAPWGRSMQLRGIILPTPIKDELLMIVAEARANWSGQ